MDYLSILFIITSIIGGSLLLWTYTKSGKKWLKEL